MRPSLYALNQLRQFEYDFSTMVGTAAKFPGYFTTPESLQMPIDPDEGTDDDANDDDIETLRRRWLEQSMNADPATRPRLPEGTLWHSVDISSSINGQLYTSNRKGLLARIARGMGISYNSLSGDLSEANYSSLRIGQIENNAQFRRVQRLLLGFMERASSEWLRWQVIRDPRIESIADRLKPVFDVPTFELIDPLKEATTSRIMIENRLRSRQRYIRESGGDPDKTLEEIVEEEAKLLELRKAKGLSDDGKTVRPPEQEDESKDDDKESKYIDI